MALLPCDFSGKLHFILLILREYGLSPDDWIFVGDGTNDVPVARKAPVSIAYAAHPELRRITTYSINSFSQLPALLDKVGAQSLRAVLS
jgi:phosphoserine phosphatase